MSHVDRRQFLRDSALGITTISTGGIVLLDQRVAKAAASERLRVGCVGVGGRAGFLMKAFAARPEVDLVTLCDLDRRKLPAAIETVERITGNTPKTETDFRKLVDDPTLDALVVGTPDHWHAIPTIMACLAGKDVYVEKPDGHNMLEGQRAVQAMRKHNRIVQMGTQSRSRSHFPSAMEYIRSGKLGKVLVVKAWESAKQGSIGRPADSRVPDGLDFDMWLGPAPKRPFNVRRFRSWEWFFDYGTGDLGNDGVHRLDYARWAMSTAAEAEGGSPLQLPSKITATGGKLFYNDMREWPDTLQVNYEFADADGKLDRILIYEMRLWAPYKYDGEEIGATVYGDAGYLILGNSRWRAYGPGNELVAEKARTSEGAVEHIQNFIDCVKTRNKPNADLETVGHPSSVLSHAGNIAWRLGRPLQLDPKTETFIGDDEANALRSRPVYRKPWTLPEVWRFVKLKMTGTRRTTSGG